MLEKILRYVFMSLLILLIVAVTIYIVLTSI